MKVFWTSLIIFSLMLGAIALNALFLHTTVNSMRRLLSEIDDPTDAAILEQTEELWKKNRTLLSLTVGIREVRMIDEGLIELRWASVAGDKAELCLQRDLLLSATEELIREESIRFSSIF